MRRTVRPIFCSVIGWTGGPAYFEDVTAASGMDQNNNRFSFAAGLVRLQRRWLARPVRRQRFRPKQPLPQSQAASSAMSPKQAGVEDLGPGMSAAWFDYDGDGRPDLYVSNMWSASGQRVVNDPAFVRSPEIRHSERRTGVT